ncbi:MAG: N-acetylmuramoyl-L-alanine amidase [Candidatus Acetothermia bacterium]
MGQMLRKTFFTIVLSTVMVYLVAAPGAAPGRSVSSSASVITIDPGHGGHDHGAIVAGVSEKSVNLAISKKLIEIGKDHPTIDFVLTRNTDNYLPLLDRLELAENNGSEGYLSIQANSYGDPGVAGVETIVDRTRAQEGPSWTMAELIQDSVVDRTGARDRGLRYQRIYTRHTSLPAAMIEVGFLTSPAERQKLTNGSYQDSVARGIIQGLLRYLSRD